MWKLFGVKVLWCTSCKHILQIFAVKVVVRSNAFLVQESSGVKTFWWKAPLVLKGFVVKNFWFTKFLVYRPSGVRIAVVSGVKMFLV